MIKIDYSLKQKSNRTIFCRIKVYSTIIIKNSNLKFFSKGLKENDFYTYVYTCWFWNVKEIESIEKLSKNPNLVVLFIRHSNKTIRNIVFDILKMLN